MLESDDGERFSSTNILMAAIGLVQPLLNLLEESDDGDVEAAVEGLLLQDREGRTERHQEHKDQKERVQQVLEHRAQRVGEGGHSLCVYVCVCMFRYIYIYMEYIHRNIHTLEMMEVWSI